MSDTLDPQTAPSAPITERTAEVRVADLVTRYVRRGAGRPVVVLRASDDADALWPELLDAIAAHCRVLIPDAPATDASFADWLRAFLDGVGHPTVMLIATRRYCVSALELALLDPERVAALVLVPRGRSDEPGLTGVLGASVRQTLPVLVVHRETPAADAVRLVEALISREPTR